MKHPQVKALLAIIEVHGLSGFGDMLNILDKVSAVEQQLNQAISELNTMRKELEGIQTKNRPPAQKALITAQAHVLDLRDKVAELKQRVIDGCKQAISAFRQNGASALDNISRFFKVHSRLEDIRSQVSKCRASLKKLKEYAAQTKPSLHETLKKNAQRSKEEFGHAEPATKRKEKTR